MQTSRKTITRVRQTGTVRAWIDSAVIHANTDGGAISGHKIVVHIGHVGSEMKPDGFSLELAGSGIPILSLDERNAAIRLLQESAEEIVIEVRPQSESQNAFQNVTRAARDGKAVMVTLQHKDLQRPAHSYGLVFQVSS
jgi:hypothetical protein